jgi:flagellar hook-associated protein 2
MPTATVSGLTSGIDWADIISQLMEFQRRPITLLETKKSTWEEKLSTWRATNTRLLALKTEADSLKTSSNFVLKTASSSDEDILTASATTSAVAGTYSITVNFLAQAHKQGSDGWADTDTTAIASASGDFTFSVGSGDAVTVAVDENTDLADFRDAINTADGGLTATILNDGSDTDPYRLILTANESGEDNTISITTNDTAGVTTNIDEFVTAYNSAITLIDQQFQYNVESETSGVLSGDATLRNIQRQIRGITSTQISGLTGDYVVLCQIGLKTGSDGQLTGDASDLSDALADDFVGGSRLFTSHGSATHGSVSYLSHTDDTEAGTYYIRIQSGTLQFSSDQSTWYDAVQDGNNYTGPDGSPMEGLKITTAAAADGNYGTTTLSLGVAAQLSRQLKYITDSYTGVIHYQEKGIEDHIDYLNDRIDDHEDRIDAMEERYIQKFAALEVLLSRMQSQSEWLASQINNL